MINVCYIQHASEGEFIEGLVKNLEPSGFRFKFVCKTKKTHQEYIDHGLESYFITHVFNENNYFSEKELKNIDLKYGLPGVRGVFNSDIQLRYFFKDNTVEADQVIARAYKFWEVFLVEHKIDYILCREIATFATRTAYNVARYKNIPLSQIASGPAGDLFILSDVGRTSVWSELLQKLSNKVQKIGINEEKQVFDFIKRRIVPDVKNKMVMRFDNINLLAGLKNLLGILWRDIFCNNAEDPIKIAALRYGGKLLRQRLVWKYWTKTFFKYDSFDVSKSFFYFPFYSGDETGYLVDNHYWANNQISLIEEVAKSLPLGYELYVKEHPTNPGYASLGELKRLKRVSNIKIIYPAFSSQTLIEKSEGVIVLQGTAGWEAFLSKKPVINLGTTFYSYSSLVYKMVDISNLSEVIRQVISGGSKIYEEKKQNGFGLFILSSALVVLGQWSN